MATDWYYTKDGERRGPITTTELKALAKAGKLQPTDLVWREGLETWEPAGKVKGLFNSVPPPPEVTNIQASYQGEAEHSQTVLLWFYRAVLAVVAIGVLCPWYVVEDSRDRFSIAGTSLVLGILTLATAVSAIVVSFLVRRQYLLPGLGGVVTALVLLAAAYLAVSPPLPFGVDPNLIRSFGAQAGVSWGLWLSVLGGLLATAVGYAQSVQQPQVSAAPPNESTIPSQSIKRPRVLSVPSINWAFLRSLTELTLFALAVAALGGAVADFFRPFLPWNFILFVGVGGATCLLLLLYVLFRSGQMGRGLGLACYCLFVLTSGFGGWWLLAEYKGDPKRGFLAARIEPLEDLQEKYLSNSIKPDPQPVPVIPTETEQARAEAQARRDAERLRLEAEIARSREREAETARQRERESENARQREAARQQEVERERRQEEINRISRERETERERQEDLATYRAKLTDIQRNLNEAKAKLEKVKAAKPRPQGIYIKADHFDANGDYIYYTAAQKNRCAQQLQAIINHLDSERSACNEKIRSLEAAAPTR
jgi:hypothetical protein